MPESTTGSDPRPQQGLAGVPAAAAYLSVSRGKVYAMINAGECPSKRFGKSVRIPWAWLHAQAEITDDETGGGK
jgi:excisionase family DNA binding protein